MFDRDSLKQRGLISTGYHLPYNPRLLERAKELRRHMTRAEAKLWFGYLQGFKYPILRQKPIDNYIVDFYCSKLKLVIEIDGDSHFTEEGKSYDEERPGYCNPSGYRCSGSAIRKCRIISRTFARKLKESPLPPLLKVGSLYNSPHPPFSKGGAGRFRKAR